MNGGDFDPPVDHRSACRESNEASSRSADPKDADRPPIGPETLLDLFDRNGRSGRFQSHEDLEWADQPSAGEDGSSTIGDPAEIAAAVLIGRALSKEPKLYARIMGDAPVLILECSSTSWIGPAVQALLRCFGSKPDGLRDGKSVEHARKGCGAVVVAARSGRSAADGGQAERAFRRFLPLFGVVAPGMKQLPEEIECACDARIVLGAVEPPDLTLVVRRITGASPSATMPALIAHQIEPMDLRVALHPSRGPDGALDRLRCVVERKGPRPTASATPRLSELHGYGAAADWGHAAVADLKAFSHGQAWSACEQGALLCGSPGVGKTLLAAAIAREADVPLIAGSLARWQAEGEAHLGTTLKAMRTFFHDAKAAAPCVALVDELDSFGDRSRLMGRNHHYGVQVINAFLECLDGADSREGVLLVGATNHPGWIDSAILRSGRFDQVIEIEAPSLADLAAILRHHLKTDLPGIDLLKCARRGLGGTGADCAAWVRRARSRARRAGAAMTEADLLREIVGSTRDTCIEAERRAAVHEAGHAVAAYALGLPVGDLVLSSPSHAGDGFMRFRAPSVLTNGSVRRLLIMLMAGREAETLAFGEPSAGATGDLKAASSLARDMHSSWGLGRWLSAADMAVHDVAISRLVEHTMRQSSRDARQLLIDRRRELDHMSSALLDRRSLTASEVITILEKINNEQ